MLDDKVQQIRGQILSKMEAWVYQEIECGADEDQEMIRL